MANKEKRETYHPTIMQAVETLSNIAELDMDRDLVVALEELPIAIPDENPALPSIQLLRQQDLQSTVDMVKEIFRVILNYLRGYYKKEYRYFPNAETTEGIKAIMVVVGEAAKKLDKYAALTHNKMESITQLKEYKHLQEFYLSRIVRKIDQSVLSQWILGLAQRALETSKITAPAAPAELAQAKHVFVDLEAVKKDTVYELFFIRKEDGSRFFNPRLIRNMKLVCDFGDRLAESKTDNPLESIPVWRDRYFHAAAQNILQTCQAYIDPFYHQLKESPDGEVVQWLNKALIALMLSSNPHHLFHDPASKCCTDYFHDFQGFLRNLLHSGEYQKWLAYSVKKQTERMHCCLDLIYALCRGLFLQLKGYQEILPQILGMLTEAHQLVGNTKKNGANGAYESLTEQLHDDYVAMAKLIKRHSHGPLMKILQELEESPYIAFDPLLQGNLPNKLFNVEMPDKEVQVIHLPSPTHQEFIHKNFLATEEFRGFLRSITHLSKGKHLLINLQDRTSWREHGRCVVLEELQKHHDFTKQLIVVTLAKDTEFYYQTSPYNQDNHSDLFIKNFYAQLADDRCGYYFPDAIKNALFPDFVEGVMKGIHHFFFGGRNILPLERRLDFIEIFFQLLELKLVEVVSPQSVSFTCKDGLDTGAAASAELYVFLKQLHQKTLSPQDSELLNMMLYTPAILVRERILLPDRFNRLLGMIKEMELVKNDMGWENFVEAFGKTFKPFFNARTFE